MLQERRCWHSAAAAWIRSHRARTSCSTLALCDDFARERSRHSLLTHRLSQNEFREKLDWCCGLATTLVIRSEIADVNNLGLGRTRYLLHAQPC